MTSRFTRSALIVLVSATSALVSVPAAMASAPASSRIVAHFDLAEGQTPENAVVLPDGSTDVTFSTANQVAHVSKDGKVTILAQLPPGGQCAIFPGAATLGLARALDGTVYVAECSGTSTTGVWRIRPGSQPVQIAELPSDGLPNGMALDNRTGDLYVSDSFLGTVWKVPTRGGAPSAWATGPTLDKITFGGANGLVLHNGAVWAGNIDQGLIVRIPIRRDGAAGPIETEVTGLTGGLDDFAVVGGDNTIVAALNMVNEVVEVKPGQQPQVLLTATDGLSTPTAVRIQDGTMYVTNGAYFGVDPNLLVAPFWP